MRRRIRVNPKTHLTCVPQECIEDGLVGDVEAYADAVTLTLVSPQANLNDIKNSLETVLRDIELRMSIERRNGRVTQPEPEELKPEKPEHEEAEIDSLERLRRRIRREE